MNQEEFFHASLKLIGIGCAIVGFDICATSIAAISAIGFLSPATNIAWSFPGLSRPVAYFGIAFLLIYKTEWCEKQFRFRKTVEQ